MHDPHEKHSTPLTDFKKKKKHFTKIYKRDQYKEGSIQRETKNSFTDLPYQTATAGRLCTQAPVCLGLTLAFTHTNEGM